MSHAAADVGSIPTVSIEGCLLAGLHPERPFKSVGVRASPRCLRDSPGNPPWGTVEVSERNVEFHRRAVEAFHARVCRWRDGLMVYGKAYVHREDALRDLGVSEDALEPIAPRASRRVR